MKLTDEDIKNEAAVLPAPAPDAAAPDAGVGESADAPDPVADVINEPATFHILGKCDACGGPVLHGATGDDGHVFHPDAGKDRSGVYVHNRC